MDARKPITRRRKWKRFKIKGGAIVLLHKARLLDVGKPKLIELGPVIDISMGGWRSNSSKTKTACMSRKPSPFPSPPSA